MRLNDSWRRRGGLCHALAVALTGVLLASCAGRPPISPPPPDPLEVRLARLGVELADLVDPWEVSDEMAAWARQRVSVSLSPADQARRLLEVLLEFDGLGVRYDATVTGTAREVFDSRRANCLGFTHLFVGLGRSLGLPVYYLGFKQRPRYEKEGDLVFVWEHITAGFGHSGDRLTLEFTIGPEIDYQGAAPIDDLTARAMHYSNLGAEALRAGDLDAAAESLELAVALDPGWAHAWVNLGVVRRRLNDLNGAEAAYRRALVAEPGHLQAYSNLATLFRLQGRRDAADAVLELLDRHDNRNPYTYLALGDASLSSGRYDEARRFYRRAVRLAPSDAEVAAAMGLLAVERDQPAKARRWLKRATRLSPDNERVTTLRRRLDAMTSRRQIPAENSETGKSSLQPAGSRHAPGLAGREGD